MAKTKTKDWADFPLDLYRQEAARLVHFSSKTVNSNAPPCGVRVGRDRALDLPLVGVRTLLADGVTVPLDYTRNAGKTATVVKQIRQAASGEPPEGVPSEHLAAIQEVTAQATTSVYEEGVDQISPRLRQILLPKGQGEYIAVTPLGSSGLSALLNQKLTALPESSRKFRQALLGFGGSNPQNVGALVREMRNPLLFKAPAENPVVRQVLSIHFRGIKLGLPRKQMADYRTWRERQIQTGGGVMPSDMCIRQEEAELVCAIARVVIQRGRQAREFLETHREVLPVTPETDSLLSPDLDEDVVRGLIEPEGRSAKWAERFSDLIARAIAAYPFGQGEVMPLADSAVAQIARWIKESLR